MQDEPNNDIQQQGDNLNVTNNQPIDSGINPAPNTDNSASTFNSNGMRTVEPINQNIVPDPINPTNYNATQPSPAPVSAPVQNQPFNDINLNSLDQNASPTSAPKKGNKKLIAIICSVVVVLLLGGGAFAANLWYQNPQKVITDALIYASTAKSAIYNGDITVDSDGTKMAISLSAK